MATQNQKWENIGKSCANHGRTRMWQNLNRGSLKLYYGQREFHNDSLKMHSCGYFRKPCPLKIVSW